MSPPDANYRWVLLPLAAIVLLGAIGLAAQDDASWDPALDAVAAAPDSHRVLLENAHVRVLEVVLPPGHREPAHTHRWPSVMVGLDEARIRYYDAEGELRFETPEDKPLDDTELSADWLRPEPLHSVENIDDRPFRALRVELKIAVGG